jgi:hypothetical protein
MFPFSERQAYFQGKSNSSIAVSRPAPAHAPPVTRTNTRVRSEAAWLEKDDKFNAVRFQRYLDYAPKIVLPVTLRSMKKPLTPGRMKKLEEVTNKLLDPSQPARCTSAQYLDRNGNPILFYFGRRLVREGEDDKKVRHSGALVCVSHLTYIRISKWQPRINTTPSRWWI